MRGAFTLYTKQKGCAPSLTSRRTEAVERAVALRKEKAELRLARITNGKHPDYQNGK
jgi:hypothetical protein